MNANRIFMFVFVNCYFFLIAPNSSIQSDSIFVAYSNRICATNNDNELLRSVFIQCSFVGVYPALFVTFCTINERIGNNKYLSKLISIM